MSETLEYSQPMDPDSFEPTILLDEPDRLVQTVDEASIPTSSGREQLLEARARQPGMVITYGPHQGAKEMRRRAKQLARLAEAAA